MSPLKFLLRSRPIIRLLLLVAVCGTAQSAAPVQSRPPTDPNVGYDHSPTHQVTITITGAVNQPGTHELPANYSVWDAIDAAGSFSPVAQKSNVHLQRTVAGMNHHFSFDWKQRKSEPHPVLLCDGDVITVGVIPPEMIKGAIAKIRVSADRKYSADFTTGPARVRISPKVIIHNLHLENLKIAVHDAGHLSELVLVKVELSDSTGAGLSIIPVDSRLPQFESGDILSPDDEQLFSLYTDYDLVIPQPGTYQLVISVRFGFPPQNDRLLFIASEPFAIEVTAAVAGTNP